MISIKALFDCLKKNEVDFFTGVPDSLLKSFCAYVTDNTTSKEHLIAANEGAAVALATGYHLATGKIPLVYMQNSGLGNAVNPLLSLADKDVYSIPMILMIGWRGEPGVKDEPQHKKQGRVQNALIEAMEIPYRILDTNTDNIENIIVELLRISKSKSSPVALVVKSNSFDLYKMQKKETQKYDLTRENAIGSVIKYLSHDDIVVSTTGFASRELFELRSKNVQSSQADFLTVGSMGHASQIALGIALNTNKRVFCIDGDGAAIMHMGSMTVAGNSKSSNFFHILINNGAHDSVGGQPTLGYSTDFPSIAVACGYTHSFSVDNQNKLDIILEKIIITKGPVFLEIKTRKGARDNLGRPTKSPIENKKSLMSLLGAK